MKEILYGLMTLCCLSCEVYSDIAWSAPVSISTALTNASDPHVVVDSSGNSTAVWVENGVIKASNKLFGGNWSAPNALSSTSNTASSPKIGIDSSGNVSAIWIENNQIESALMSSSGTWGIETSPISGSGASSPTLAVDASGNAVALWVLGGNIQAASRIAGTWGSVTTLTTITSSNPSIAISSYGTAVAAWHSISSGSDLIVSNIFTISSNTWGTNKNLFSAAATFNHNYPKVAIDSSGNASIVWFRYNFLNGNSYQNVQVLTSTLPQGAASWAIASILSNSGIRNPADLTLKLKYDTNGDSIVVWTNSYDGLTFNVESSYRLFGATSWDSFTIPYLPSLYSFGIDLALSSGTALLTYMQWDGLSTIFIQSQESETTNPLFQAWSLGNPYSTGTENGYPSCGFSSAGSSFYAASVWISYNGVNSIINASTGSSAMIAAPPTLLATQTSTNYGVYTDYANTLTWTPSTDPNVIQYSIFRDGVYFAATDQNTFSFIDHNQVNGGKVVYGVAALTSSYRQSQITFYTIFP